MATLSGLAVALSFPQPGLAGLAWIAPAGLLFAALGRSPAGAFRIGYLGGFAQQLVGLGWLLAIPFPGGNVAAWLALSAYVALYQGLWVMLSLALIGTRRPDSTPGGWLEHADGLLNLPLIRRILWPLLCAANWAGLEIIQSHFLSGFPWNMLGTSQYSMTPVIQIASFTGVYGVSFLLVWTAVSLGMALLSITRQPTARWGWMGDLRFPLLVVVIIGCMGMVRLTRQPGVPPTTLKVAMVQPSIPQELIWDEAADAERFNDVMRLSELALATGPDLLIWPESAFARATRERYQAISSMISLHGAWMIFSSEDVAPHPSNADSADYDVFNAAFLLNPEGALDAIYHKQRLVIFGEYVPLSDWLPFLRKLTPIEGGFTPGRGPVTFRLKDPDVAASVLICFEDVFAHGARQHVHSGLQLFINLTNNGWFGEGSAQWQHAAAGVFRAVENGIPLVRATNNGLTCWIDGFGRLREWIGRESGDIYGPGFLTASVEIPPPDRELTFYTRHGDVFGWTCAALLLLPLIRLRYAKGRTRL